MRAVCRSWLVMTVLIGAASTPAAAQRSADPPSPDGSASSSLEKYEGLVSPSQQVELSAPFEDRLAEVLVKEGEQVEAEQLLARLEDAEQVKRVEAARIKANQAANLRRAEASLEQARLKVKRMKEAYEAEAISPWEYRTAEAARDQAKAEVAIAKHQQTQAEAELALAQARLARYRIRAPFAGRVRRIEIDAGATLTPRKTLLSLVKLDPLEAELYLPARFYNRMQPGRRYQLQAGEPINRTLPARLTHISPVIDSASGAFRCVFTIDNPGGDLPAGFPVHLSDLAPLPVENAGEKASAARTRPTADRSR